MSNIHTITTTETKMPSTDWTKGLGHRLQEAMTLQDNGSCTTLTIPQKLSNSDVCAMFEKYLQYVDEEDRKECIETLRKTKITGRTLVECFKNAQVMKEVKEALGYALEYRLRFEEMITDLNKRETDLKGQCNDQSNKEVTSKKVTPASDSASASKDTVQNIHNVASVVGVMNNHGENQEIYNGCTYGQDPKKDNK